MDIFLSINNREQIIKLPVVPTEFLLQSPFNNETWSTIGQGDIKLIGMKALRSISIQSFFPSKDYPFLRDKTYKAWEYVNMIENWRYRRLPVRLVMTQTNINIPVVIDNFEYGIKDGTNDVYYTLTLSEFRFIQLQKKGVK